MIGSTQRILNLGIVGLGRAFSLMLPTFIADPRVKLAGATDPREGARAQFARDFAAPVFDSVETLCAAQDIDAVYVASPHQYHAEHVRIAAAAGKHVMVEKPMALTLSECQSMIDAARAHRVHLIVGHSHSFDGPILQARALIESGRFGAVRMITALNYTDFIYRPRRPEELDSRAGGGVVFSQAAHQVDIVRLLAGAPVTGVYAQTGNWDPSRSTEGAYTATLNFAGGAFATLTYNGYGHFDSDEFCGGIGELGTPKDRAAYGASRRALAKVANAAEEARLKNERTYGGAAYALPSPATRPAHHQHFGLVIVSCEHADLRPTPAGVTVYGHTAIEEHALPVPAVPRREVIDELYGAAIEGRAPLHDGEWGTATMAVVLAIAPADTDRKP